MIGVLNFQNWVFSLRLLLYLLSIVGWVIAGHHVNLSSKSNLSIIKNLQLGTYIYAYLLIVVNAYNFIYVTRSLQYQYIVTIWVDVTDVLPCPEAVEEKGE